MEFFKLIDIQTSEARLQQTLSLPNLENYCSSMFPIEDGEEQCLIGSNWGEFQLKRDRIKGGVRFCMLDCPNALAWTVTTGYPPHKEGIVIHLTINRTEKDSEFVEEIELLLNEMEEGLNNSQV